MKERGGRREREGGARVREVERRGAKGREGERGWSEEGVGTGASIVDNLSVFHMEHTNSSDHTLT